MVHTSELLLRPALNDNRSNNNEPLRVLFVSSWNDYATRMDRFLFDLIEAAESAANVTLWGPDFDGWTKNRTAEQNFALFCQQKEFDLIFVCGFDVGIGSECTSKKDSVLIFEVGDCHFREDFSCRESVPLSAHIVSVRYGHLLVTQFYETPLSLQTLPPKLYFHIPDCANAHHFVKRPPRANRSEVLLIGSSWAPLYPLRHNARRAHDMGLINNSVVFQHPGYELSQNISWHQKTYNRPFSRGLRANQLKFYEALKSASICVFDSSVVRKSIRKFYEAALAGCVIASDLPLDLWIEFQGKIVELPPNASPEEIAVVLNGAQNNIALLNQLSKSARAVVLSKFTCMHKFKLIALARSMYLEGRRGYYFPHSVAIDCHHYQSNWRLPFCTMGGVGLPTPLQGKFALRASDVSGGHSNLTALQRVGCDRRIFDTLDSTVDACFSPSSPVILISADSSSMFVLHTVERWRSVGRSGSDFLVLCIDVQCARSASELNLTVFHMHSHEGALSLKRGVCETVKTLLTFGRSVLMVNADVFLTGRDDPLHYMRSTADPSWDLQASMHAPECHSNRTMADGRCFHEISSSLMFFRAHSGALEFVQMLINRVDNRTIHSLVNDLVASDESTAKIVYFSERWFIHAAWYAGQILSDPSSFRSVSAGALTVRLSCEPTNAKQYFANAMGLLPDYGPRDAISWEPRAGDRWTRQNLSWALATLLIAAVREDRAIVPFEAVTLMDGTHLPFHAVVNFKAFNVLNLTITHPDWWPVREYALWRVRKVTGATWYDPSFLRWILNESEEYKRIKSIILCAEDGERHDCASHCKIN